MKELLLLTALLTLKFSFSQCDTNYIVGDYNVNSDEIMSGVYYVDGDFIVSTASTVYLESFEFGACGSLVIFANNIEIYGAINGDFAGYEGGEGGLKGTVISSITGHLNSLTDCQNKDDAGRVEVEGGFAGEDGHGNGGGLAGENGEQGAGPKQQCMSGDEAGMIAGAAGAGGGSGGSYGGLGSAGQNGGSGSEDYTVSEVSISGAYAVQKGDGGLGGLTSAIYGTATGNDIDLGSGGAGAGGGGRSFDTGLDGGKGGAGGGMIKLVAYEDLVMSGSISANGEVGENGGSAGSGGVSPKCCSDLCDDCGEATVSAGAGAGSGAGGGSGGGIYIEVGDEIEVTGDLSVTGGDGGLGGTEGYGTGCNYDAGFGCGNDQAITSGDGEAGSAGGAGGGGRIKIFYSDCSVSIVTPVTNVEGGQSIAQGEDGTVELNCDYASLDDQKTLAIELYPNPAQNIIQISLDQIDISTAISIFNLQGEQVYSETGAQLTNTINVSDFSSGMYVVKVVSESAISTINFIKQ